MKFSVTSSLIAITALNAGTTAFVIDTFGDSNCGQGNQNGVNIWDNTCATWPNGFKSFKITTWGGSHQMAYFFAPGNCGSLPNNIKKGYVDSTTYDFRLNECVSFNGAAANAIASYST